MQTETVRGLTQAEVAERVASGRVNDVSDVPSRSVRDIVRANVFTRFNALLGSMFAIIVVVGPAQDALFGGVLVGNMLIGVVQELRAKRTLDRLTVLTAPKARALREAGVRELPIGDVVMDDVLEVGAGDQIVVDGDVVEAAGLEVDESLITGESDPVAKAPGDEVLSGSFAAAGTGRFRATRVGREAYATRLAEDARRFTLTRSELRAGIDRILWFVTIAIVPTAALLFISQFRAHEGLRTALASAVAGTVAMVPEGLVLLTSVAFAVGVMRLARRRVLVQELPAVEGLARVDVLCIDKTGTLTEGRLAVEEVEVLGDRDWPYEAALAGLAAADPNPNATMLAIAERFPRPQDGWEPTETVPFSSARKWSAATFGGQGSWILGAPDVLLPPGAGPRVRAEEHAALGRRVLLLAKADGSPTGEAISSDLEPVALVSLGDRPREDAARTLEYFARQGVAVKVLSGDHPATVGAIGRRLGAPGAEDPVDAKLLSDDPSELADALQNSSVFGRVTPQQKREMVRALQSRGHVVAMTGDGVNDVLALKDSDIGVAMGAGAPATRAVAQLVLLDSTFDALPKVVAEGRRVLGNIERTSGLYLTKTVYAMLLSLAVGVAGQPFPFLPRHLTLIGSITIGIPSFFLALAPNEERAKPGFLGRVARLAIPAGVLAAVATFLAYRIVAGEENITLAQQRTAATMVLTWIGLLILSIIAAPLTRSRLLLVWSMAGLFLAALLLPPVRSFFGLQIPDDVVWLAAFGIAAIVWSFARLFVPGDRPVGPRTR
ncbi:MAG TPA: HAD-IC family P-type ATPase [Actinomycetota bacterium]|jgi:cation-transporting ATPase E|nr:HAD-IC family P-type ATPase [Actinomycetota bacterium]